MYGHVAAIASSALCFLLLPNGRNLAHLVVVEGVLFDVAVTLVALTGAVWWVRDRVRSARVPVGAPRPPSPPGLHFITLNNSTATIEIYENLNLRELASAPLAVA